MSTSHIELLLISLKPDEFYGIDVSTIIEVTSTPAITTVPQALPCVAGMINFRGDIIPIMFLTKMIQRETPNEGKLLLTVELDTKKYGFLIHGVDKIIRVPVSDITTLNTPQNLYVDGYVQPPNYEIIQILNLHKLLKRYI